MFILKLSLYMILLPMTPVFCYMLYKKYQLHQLLKKVEIRIFKDSSLNYDKHDYTSTPTHSANGTITFIKTEKTFGIKYYSNNQHYNFEYFYDEEYHNMRKLLNEFEWTILCPYMDKLVEKAYADMLNDDKKKVMLEKENFRQTMGL